MNPSKRGPGRPKKDPNSDLYAPNQQQEPMKKLHTGTRQLSGVKKYESEEDDYYQDDKSNGGSDDDSGEFEPRRGMGSKKGNSSMRDKSKGRHDNSLSVLTKKFIQLIKASPNLTVNLNEVVKELNVQKRRIYDITNVLEGIGYIEKVLKNKIRWVGSMDETGNGEDVMELMDELENLRMEETDVDRWTNYLQESLAGLAKDDANNKFSYVAFDDIKAVNTQPKDDGQPFFVIRAPKGTTLEVPVPNQEGPDDFPHKLSLTSQEEPIFVYVVSDNKAGGEVGQLKF